MGGSRCRLLLQGGEERLAKLRLKVERGWESRWDGTNAAS